MFQQALGGLAVGVLWIERQLLLLTLDSKSDFAIVMAGLFSHAPCPCSSLYPRVVKQYHLRAVTCAFALVPAAQPVPFLAPLARCLKPQGQLCSFRW